MEHDTTLAGACFAPCAGGLHILGSDAGLGSCCCREREKEERVAKEKKKEQERRKKQKREEKKEQKRKVKEEKKANKAAKQVRLRLGSATARLVHQHR